MKKFRDLVAKMSPERQIANAEATKRLLALDDFREFIRSPDEVRARLEAAEKLLSDQYGITGDVRQELLRRSRNHELPDSPEVVEWQLALAMYLSP